LLKCFSIHMAVIADGVNREDLRRRRLNRFTGLRCRRLGNPLHGCIMPNTIGLKGGVEIVVLITSKDVAMVD